MPPNSYVQAAFAGPRISLEIQEQVIDHLWDEPYYLIPCRLVCRAWCIRSSQHFYRFIRIDNLRSLKRFNTLLLSSDSAAYWARDLLSSKETQNDDVCAHLIPHYTARKLPHLHHLEFSATIDHQLGPPTVYYHSNPSAPPGVSRYDAIHCQFPCHPSMFMHLSQFRGVSSFTLTGYHFMSFSDLRRMVGALRVLRRLEVIGVTWEIQGDPFKNQIKTIPTALTHLSMRDCTSDFIGVSFWVWTIPNSKVALAGGMHAAAEIPVSHPQICVEDARALVDITDFVSKAKSLSRRARLQGISYEWTQKSETSWVVACGQDTPMYPEPLFSLTVETTIPSSQSSATSRSNDNNRALTTNFSIAFDFQFSYDLHNFDWKHLDHLLIDLHNLQSLRIRLRCKQSTLRKPNSSWETTELQSGEVVESDSRYPRNQFTQSELFEKNLNLLHLEGIMGISSMKFGGTPGDILHIERTPYEEYLSYYMKEGLKLVAEQMLLMRPVLSLDFTWL